MLVYGLLIYLPIPNFLTSSRMLMLLYAWWHNNSAILAMQSKKGARWGFRIYGGFIVLLTGAFYAVMWLHYQYNG